MGTNSQIQKRAIAYSFLAHVNTTGTFTKGPVEIFVPIVKNALSELYPDGAAKGANLSEIEIAIDDKFGLDIPTPVYDTTFLNAVGCGYTTPEHTGDTLYAIIVAFSRHLGCSHFCILHTLGDEKAKLFACHHSDGLLE